MTKRQIVIPSMTTNPNHKAIETMREMIQESQMSIGEMAPQEVEFLEVKVADLMSQTLPQYQRGFELNRAKMLVQSMTQYGYMPASIIIIVKRKNGTLDLHDGRHRSVAAYVVGIDEIPAALVTFKNEADEIRHFNTINEAKTGTKLEQKILNGFQANEPLSMLIYDLGYMDSKSAWSNKVALLGVDLPKDKMSVANFCKVINWAGLGLRRRREGESNIRALAKMEKVPYDKILAGVNQFHDWFYNFATPVKVQNDVFHKDKVLISMLEFFYCALRQNSKLALLQPERILKTSIKTFRNFNFRMLSTYDAATAPDKLFEHFNKKRNTYPVKRI